MQMQQVQQQMPVQQARPPWSSQEGQQPPAPTPQQPPQPFGVIEQAQAAAAADAAAAQQAIRQQELLGLGAPGEQQQPGAAGEKGAKEEATEEEAAKPKVHAPRPKIRTSTKQVGRMYVSPDEKRGGNGAPPKTNAAGMLTVGPQAYVQVQWEMPQSIVDSVGGSGGLTIALYRLGQLSNDHAIVKKDIQESRNVRRQQGGGGGGRVSGWIRFYAPKGVGRFVFRIYDEADIVPTLGTLRFHPFYLS